MKEKQNKFQVFYDGACYLCSGEIDHYRKKETLVPFEFIDISSPEFRAESYGLEDKAVQLEMHVKSEEGTVTTGVDAFLEIWRRIPSFQRLEIGRAHV